MLTVTGKGTPEVEEMANQIMAILVGKTWEQARDAINVASNRLHIYITAQHQKPILDPENLGNP